MKASKYFGLVLIITLAFSLIPNFSVAAAAVKVDVCHVDEYGVFHLINISENAYDTHVAHGDAGIGGWVPGHPGNKFAADCSMIPVEKKNLVDSFEVTGASKVANYSNIVLEANQLYELKAIGTYKFADWTNAGIADAKYSKRIASVPPYVAGWIDGANLNIDPLKAYGLQVTLVDGDLEKPLTPVGWVEPYNEAHIYTAPYTGTGAKLAMLIWDDRYGDNSGYITIEVYKINW